MGGSSAVDNPVVTVLFTDVVASTQLYDGLGDAAAHAVLARHDQAARDVVEGHGGRRVKGLGDGMLAVFRSPRAALRAAIDLQDASLSATEGPRVMIRVGLSAGEVIEDAEGDVHGSAVVVASRLMALAGPGIVLCSDVVARLVATLPGVTFHQRGPVHLKGLSEASGVVEVRWERQAPSDHHDQNRTDDSSDVIVGRVQERGCIADALGAALRGQPGLVLVSGEPGIGKTRVARELIADATRVGCVTAWANGWEGAGAPPLWPWAQVVNSVMAGLEPSGADVRGLAPILSDLGGAGEDAAESRRRLFDAVADLLDRAASYAPVAMVFDDLQWADEASLVLLRHVAQGLHGRVLIVGTYRHADVAADPRLGELFSSIGRSGVDLRLEGMPAADLVTIVGRTIGSSAEPAVLEAVAARSGGNPYFAEELARLVRLQGDAGTSVPSALPPTVVQVVERRLAYLPQQVVGVLELAAVIGERFGVDDLADGGVTADDAIAAIDGASRAGLVTSAPGGFGFAHALVRDALLHTIGPGRAANLHATVAAALDARDGPVERRAHHFLGAVGVGERERGVDCAIEAGESALRRLAHEDAVGWFDRALAVVEDESQRRRALVGRAEAYRRSGDPMGARDDLAAAVASSRRDGDGVDLARAALVWHRLGSMSGQLNLEVVELLEEAVVVLPLDERAIRCSVLASLATELWDHAWQRAEDARQASAEALAIAEDLGDPGLLAVALQASYTVEWAPGRAGQRVAIASRMAEVARRAGDLERHATALLLEATARIELGDAYGLTVAERFFDVGTSVRAPRMHYQVLTRRAALAVMRGDEADASALLDESHALATALGEADAVLIEAHQRCELLRFEQGRGAFVDQPIFPERSAGDVSLFGRVERIVMLLDAGRDHEARALLAIAAAVPLDAVKRDWIFVHNVIDLAEAAVRLDDLALARRCYEALEPFAGTACVVTAFVCFSGAVDHHLGVLALALSDLDHAVEHLRAGAEMHRRLGAQTWLSHSRDLLAEADQRRMSVPAGTLERAGRVWRLRWQGREAHVPDSKGMQDIARLLASPEEIHAAELYGAVKEDRGAAMTDDEARRAYRSRLAELDAALDDADVAGDQMAGERARVERDALIDELRHNFDVHGRPRHLGDTSERARKAVSARIRDAIKVIGAVDDQIGDHFRTSVRTGVFCAYEPPVPCRWEVRQI